MEQEKLYSPVNFFLRDSYDAEEGLYDEGDYWRDDLSHRDAFGYMREIKSALADDRQHYDNGRGLAEYLDAPLQDKVQSLFPAIELHGDQLWTVAHIELNEPLVPAEIAELKEWWEGQLSDGWGESFEQHEIKVDRGDLYVEPWEHSDDFFIATQAEFDRRMGIEQPAAEETLPELHPDDLIDNMEVELFSRLDKNLSDFCESLLVEDKQELIGMAEEIATRFAVRDYLKSDHRFNLPELELLLQFKSPLTVVSEHTPSISKLLDMSGAISEIANLDGALRREYPMEQQYAVIRESFDSRDEQLTQIARKHCRVETLEERKRDSLDFHEVSVWGLKAALQEAFDAGAAQQMAKEAAVELSEPTPAPVVDEQGLRDTLEARLEQNLADMINDLRSDISGIHLPTSEVVSLADRITAVSAAYEYLTGNTIPLDQAEYLIQFQNPLEVVADRWPSAASGTEYMDELMWDICDKQDALQGDYSLMTDIPAASPEPPRESPAPGKTSLLAGLREAKTKSDQQKPNPATNKSEPEL